MFGIIRLIINTIAIIIELLLVFRLVLKFLQANPGTPFVAWIYSMTQWLVAPFSKILPNWKICEFRGRFFYSFCAYRIYHCRISASENLSRPPQ